MHSDYVPLHLHTHYSLLDGAIRIEELIEKASEYKLPAMAITDHGNLFGAIEFYKKVSKAGIKPIIGCEVYIAPGSRFDREPNTGNGAEKSFHLILLARDINGYRNLTTLVTRAYLEGFYYKPRIDKDLLEQYSGGLIGLTSCLKGEVPYLLEKGLIDKAREAAIQYRHILGPDNFYIELQANGLPEQERVNKLLVELSSDLHLGLVATNDCHYLNREDAKAHDVLICIQTGKSLDDKDRMRFSGDEFYFKSPDEMKAAFREIPEAIKNTRAIAERCNLDLKFGCSHLPQYNVMPGHDFNSYLEKLAWDGLEKRFNGDAPQSYKERLELELKIIKEMGFSSYFLIVWDFIRFAKDKGIPVGPGRGSAVGSLVAYCLSITELDPLRYDLLFERFLNPERISMPDIDVDFCQDRRQEVIDYVAEKYGKDHVSQIITFGTMAARAAVRDVGRAMNIPYGDVDRVAKLIPNVLNITLKEALGLEPKLRELYDVDEKVRELIDIAMRLEGLCRHASTHAAGVVISPEPLTSFAPLYKSANEETITTQFDMESIESLGLLKFDFLGLKTLTIIDKTEKLLKKSGTEFSAADIPLDDRKTFELLSSGQTTGIFQLESRGMRDFLTRMRPERFEDLIALVALYRPGPLGSGMVDDFIKRRRGEVPIKYELPQLEEILKETYGVILYQEQVMRIANKLANFTMGQADTLRKAMGKKNPEVMERLKGTFIDGAKANKIPPKKAERIFDLMAYFAGYGFNKSHSAAYAYIAYQTAYLKAHYPVEFMAASLSADMDNTTKVVSFINECKEMGIEILPPDINESDREFKVCGNSIRFGLEAVKGVGGSAIEAILNARAEGGTFKSLYDFSARVDSRRVNRKVIESLIKAGAFDSTGKRAQLMAAVDRAIQQGAIAQKAISIGQGNIFDLTPPSNDDLPDMDEWDESEQLRMEKEALGFYITGHPLNKYREQLMKTVIPTSELSEIDDKSEVTVGGVMRGIKKVQTKNKGETMAYLTLEDLDGTVEVILFPELYKGSMDVLSGDIPVIISGTLDKTDKGCKIIARRLSAIDSNGQTGSLEQGRKRDPAASGGYRHQRPEGQKTVSRVDIAVVHSATDREKLSALKAIADRYSGNCPLYIRITYPDLWEAVIATKVEIEPTSEMISDVEALLGQGGVRLILK